MKWSEFFEAQLEREALISARALERVPEGRPDWKPHEKSMPLGYLSAAKRRDGAFDLRAVRRRRPLLTRVPLFVRGRRMSRNSSERASYDGRTCANATDLSSRSAS